jgi:hypothetical protein
LPSALPWRAAGRYYLHDIPLICEEATACWWRLFWEIIWQLVIVVQILFSVFKPVSGPVVGDPHCPSHETTLRTKERYVKVRPIGAL